MDLGGASEIRSPADVWAETELEAKVAAKNCAATKVSKVSKSYPCRPKGYLDHFDDVYSLKALVLAATTFQSVSKTLTPYNSSVDTLRDSEGLRKISRPQRRSQSKLAIVGQSHGVVLTVEPNYDNHWPKRFLSPQSCVQNLRTRAIY
ncbi:MAG: hypothetical protein Q9165_007806 [Trypethelium subeluteriae]